MRSRRFYFGAQFGLEPAQLGNHHYKSRMSLQNINVLYGVTTTETHLSLKGFISPHPLSP